MCLNQVIMTLHFLHDVIDWIDTTIDSYVLMVSLIEYQVRVFLYQVYQAMFQEDMSNRSTSPRTQ